MMSHGATRREVLKRGATLGALALGGPAVLGACGVESGGGGDKEKGIGESAVTYAEAKKTKHIKVGFANEAPWAFMDEDGKLTGYSPTVALEVLKKLGIEQIDGVVTDFDGLIDGVKAKNYAFVAAGMFINPERCEGSAFAIPDYKVGSAFMVPEGNPKNITRFEDITKEKVKIATLGGAVENGYAEQAGVPKKLIEPMAKQDDILRAVKNGDVYGAAILDVTAAWLVKGSPDAGLEVTESFNFTEGNPDVGTFNFRRGDTEFLNDFNRELKKLHESGEWVKLVEPWGLTEANDTKGELTAEEYCEA